MYIIIIFKLNKYVSNALINKSLTIVVAYHIIFINLMLYILINLF